MYVYAYTYKNWVTFFFLQITPKEGGKKLFRKFLWIRTDCFLFFWLVDEIEIYAKDQKDNWIIYYYLNLGIVFQNGN